MMLKSSLILAEKKKNKTDFPMMTKWDTNKISMNMLKIVNKIQCKVNSRKKYVNIVTQGYKFNLSKLKKLII